MIRGLDLNSFRDEAPEDRRKLFLRFGREIHRDLEYGCPHLTFWHAFWELFKDVEIDPRALNKGEWENLN